jgi:hypothetical protein
MTACTELQQPERNRRAAREGQKGLTKVGTA